jgi:hypothetical protein
MHGRFVSHKWIKWEELDVKQNAVAIYLLVNAQRKQIILYG